MKYLQRKIRAKYIGDDEHRPRDLSSGKFIPVIGYETERKEKTFDGVLKVSEEIYLLVIDDKGKLIRVAAFNCVVMIDEADGDVQKIAEVLRNATILLKTLSDRVASTEKV